MPRSVRSPWFIYYLWIFLLNPFLVHAAFADILNSQRSARATPVTSIEISDEVMVPRVKPFGIVVGSRMWWGAEQFLKNMIDNPGFEAGLYHSIIHADEGASGTRIPQANWDTGWNDDALSIGQPEGFWNGAQYEIVYGPARGRTGQVADFTHENRQYVFYLDENGERPEKWDVIMVRKELPGISAYGTGHSADTTEIRPGSPGTQSLRLVYSQEPWDPAYSFYMDSLWRDGDRSAGKLFLVKGNWRLRFWAKGAKDGDRLRFRFFREDEADFVDETIPLGTEWQKIERDVFIPEGMDPVRDYTDQEYHPILGFAFYIPTKGHIAWVDDLALYCSDNTNPTVFTDRFVNRLKELRPGILRDWHSHRFGNDLVTGMAGIALPLHMLVYLRDMGVKNQAAFCVSGFSTNWQMNNDEDVRLFGLLRDLEATGRKRPTWLGLELVNQAVMGDMLTTVQGGANPFWHQMPFNGVQNEIDVSYVQSFAFRQRNRYALILFNLSLDQTQSVRLGLPASPESQAVRSELSSDSIHDDNEEAENVILQSWQLTDFADQYKLTLPPHSINVITWTAGASCPDCTGSRVALKNVTFPLGTPCECIGETSITIGPGVTIPDGATADFTAPIIKLGNGFHAEEGAILNLRQPP